MAAVKNTGKNFENLTQRVFELLAGNDLFTTVEPNVLLDSPDGKRQFDVIVRSKVGTLDILTVIECRDFNKNLSVIHVDGLYSKQCDVNANKAVLVARKGFSSGAKKKAKRLGITLCTAHDLERGLKNVGLEIPVVVVDIESCELRPTCTIQTGKKTTNIDRSEILRINGVPVGKALEQAIQQSKVRIRLNEVLVWRPKESDDGSYIRDQRGEKLVASDIEVLFTLKGTYYFGYLHDLPSTIGLKNISQEESHLFFDPKDIVVDYVKNFSAYKRHVDLPLIGGFTLIATRSLDFKVGASDMNIEKIEKIET